MRYFIIIIIIIIYFCENFLRRVYTGKGYLYNYHYISSQFIINSCLNDCSYRELVASPGKMNVYIYLFYSWVIANFDHEMTWWM